MQVAVRLDVEKHDRIERFVEHGAGVRATLPRYHAGEAQSGAVRPRGQGAKPGAGTGGDIGRESAHCAEAFVPSGDVAEQHQGVVGFLEAIDNALDAVTRQQLCQPRT